MGIELGAKINRKAIAITMQSAHIKINPPIIIPTHAMGLPDSLCLRILFNEIVPNVSARIPSSKLAGKQRIPVKGIGSKPVHNDRMVKIPKTRLKIDCELIGGTIISSLVLIKVR